MNKLISVLIDTNVVYTYLTEREDAYLNESRQIIYLCASERIKGYIAFHTLSNIWFIARKVPSEIRRSWLFRIYQILTVVGASHASVLEAIHNNNFPDFEDCLQDKCAKDAGCNYLITTNIKDFSNIEVHALTPHQFLELLG